MVSALFPIVDPIGGSPVFLLLTRDYAAETRRALARRIAIDSFILLVASFTLGAHVLSFFGISLPVVQVGGGLIVISTGWAMLNEKDGDDRPARRSVTLLSILAAAIGSAFMAVTIYLCYGYADRLASKLGPTGTNVILKLTAFLLVCIGVQILWNGASKLLSSLPQFAAVAASFASLNY
ncbi:MAG: MarC family protein [Terriglobales bacterium]